MRNRAKCRLCADILESFYRDDFVECSCKEIAIEGGPESLKCYYKDPKNFLRIDDENNEIEIKVLDKQEESENPVLTREDRIKMLEIMVKNMEALPNHAMNSPITHYDLYSHLLVILSIFKTP